MSVCEQVLIRDKAMKGVGKRAYRQKKMKSRLLCYASNVGVKIGCCVYFKLQCNYGYTTVINFLNCFPEFIDGVKYFFSQENTKKNYIFPYGD